MDPLALIRRGCVDLINEAELKQKLASRRPLIIKAGFDPTAPDLHLGHTVLLRKLRHFQDLGHQVIFLIGDATALVGDPSGQTQVRRMLTWEEVRTNSQTYLQQVKTILRTERHLLEIRYNSEWFLGRSPQNRTQGLETFDFTKWLQLASRYTVARVIERDDFSQRLKSGKPLSFLELCYPLMQGYDSVKIAEQYGHCDVELGGTDQTFNLLLGRDLLKEYGHEPQVVLTLPLLEGLDGTNKMSKSLGNHVGIHDASVDMFGKLMSIPDSLIIKYFTLLTDTDEAALQQMDQRMRTRQVNPRDVKADLATALVTLYHSADAAAAAKQEFFKVFSQRQTPTDMPTVTLDSSLVEDGKVKLVELLVAAKLADSKNEARRLLKQSAVKLNGTAVTEPTVSITTASGATLQVGPRHFRRLIETPR